MNPSDPSTKVALSRVNDPVLVIMFQQRFAADVRAGWKTQTIRPNGRRARPKMGQKVSLRQWSGKPYRSPQILLRETRLSLVQKFRANWEARQVWVDGVLLEGCDSFARADGFADMAAMASWFLANHKGTEFEGFVMHWPAL